MQSKTAWVTEEFFNNLILAKLSLLFQYRTKAMKIRILSDLHLEFFPFSIPAATQDKETVLVLAGDIAPFAARSILEPFLQGASRQFRAVCFVPGNHEYYGGVWPLSLDRVKRWNLPDNVHILDRASVRIDDITFLGATLWTDMGAGDPILINDAPNFMADFEHIYTPSSETEGLRCLTPRDTMADHQRSVAWFARELAYLRRTNQKAVMITHHGLTPRSVHKRFMHNALNGAFVSDLTGFLFAHQPTLAIHGHTHDSFDYYVEHTRVIVNPRGYTRHHDRQENPRFAPMFLVDI